MKSVITCTFGRILKLDSTRKVCLKPVFNFKYYILVNYKFSVNWWYNKGPSPQFFKIEILYVSWSSREKLLDCVQKGPKSTIIYWLCMAFKMHWVQDGPNSCTWASLAWIQPYPIDGSTGHPIWQRPCSKRWIQVMRRLGQKESVMSKNGPEINRKDYMRKAKSMSIQKK